MLVPWLKEKWSEAPLTFWHQAHVSAAVIFARQNYGILNKISVGAVSYLNTKPLLYGIKRHAVMDQLKLVENYPAEVARMLIGGEIELGLVPVASLLRMDEWHIISDYGIGCDGAVASVCIFSEVPIADVDTMLLDYQSRTSVNLAKILLQQYWKKDVAFVNVSGEDYRSQIGGRTAGVVIGDRALEQRQKSKYIYDLGEAWKNLTGLPFLFAAWVSRRQLPEAFTAAFNEANAEGLLHIPDVIAENPSPYFDLAHYYNNCIKYKLTEDVKKGLHQYLSELRKLHTNDAVSC